MQGLFSFRLVLAVVLTVAIVITSLAGATSVKSQEESRHPLYATLADTIGLTMDRRGNLYTVEGTTGHVFCIPPESSPILLAKVPGRPTAVAVDHLRTVYVGTDDGTIFMVSLDGSVYEAYRCSARPVGLEVDRDGSLVVATEDGRIARIGRGSLTVRQ